MVALPQFEETPAGKYLRMYRNALMVWSGHTADELALSSGAVYANGTLCGVPEANCIIGELTADDRARMRERFNSANAQALAWHFAPEDISGFAITPLTLQRLERMPADLPRTNAELTIIPARAAFAQLGECAYAMRPEIPPEQTLEAEMCHLDDPHADAVIALRGGRGVGYASVLSVGDVGLITRLFVTPELRGHGYGLALAGQLLDICTRSMFRDILLATEANNPALEMLARAGFSEAAKTQFARRIMA